MIGEPVSRRQCLHTAGVAAAVGISGCVVDGSDSDTADVEMTLASPYEPGHILVQASEDLKKRVEAETGGRFRIDINAGGAYGGEGTHAELLLEGSLDAVAAGTPVWQRYATEYFIFNVPYSLRDFEHIIRIMQSDVMQEGRKRLRQYANHRMIGGEQPWIYRGTRHFTANQPVRSPEDLRGLSLRVPQVPSWVELWSSMGTLPTAIALNELYTALQTGTADASEGPPDQIQSNNLQEVQSHYSLTGHHVTPGALYVANDWFERLDKSYRDLLTELGPDVHRRATERSMERESKLIDELSNRMQIIENVDTDALRRQAEPTVRALFEDNWVIDYDELQAMY